MSARRRWCAQCFEPLRATARSDARYCSPACKQAARRARAHFAEAVDIGLALVTGTQTPAVVRCPACGHRFALGHGHRRDAVYDRPACRQSAYRRRRAQQRVREAVTPDRNVTAARTPCTPLTSRHGGAQKDAPAEPGPSGAGVGTTDYGAASPAAGRPGPSAP